MEQPHQHGPQCRHGPGGHGGHGHGGHGHGSNNHGRSSEMSPNQYFKKLGEMKKSHPQFYWTQIISGQPLNKYFEQKGLDFCRSINCQVITMIVAQAEMMFTCQWLPLYIRPFISGLFFPLLFLIFFNFNVIFGVADPNFTFVHFFAYLTIIFYILTAIKQAGFLNTSQNQKKTQQAIKQRPYLQNPNANCQSCKILKVFRSFHCPICKVCVSKFTRHSLAFGVCIGSSNELLAWGFFIFLTLTQTLTLMTFFSNTHYGLITNIMFYALNCYILWISFVQASTFLIMNFCFGITEHEIRAWMMSQYLMKVPERQFANSVTKGFLNNLIQSSYALLKIPGYESQRKKNQNPLQEQIPISGKNNQFEPLDKNKVYLVNWSRAFFYLTPQIPSHPSRDKVIEIMTRDQPKMIEMFRMQKKFKEQVLKETEGQQLSQMQIQQRVGMKMQQYMMKNSPNMMPQQAPSQQQQKMMQIQMLTHMYGQLQSSEPQFAQKVNELLSKLKQNKITPMQVGMTIRQIQQDLMKKKMQGVMRQKEEMQKAQKIQQHSQQDQQEQLRKQQIPDEDL